MTNSTVEFLSHLTNLSIYLETDGDDLSCYAPEGALTPTLRQEIAGRKTEIIIFLQQAKRVKAAHQLPIQRMPRDGELPLSFAQQRLWFLHQISPDSRSYNMLLILRLDGSLNIVALLQSLSELVHRHEVLRTTFPTVDGNPIQLIAPDTALTLPIHDLHSLSALEQTAQIQQIAKSQASQPFSLAVGPLVEFTLLQLSDQEYVLLLKMHHIIYDGWSLNIFNRELSQLYAAFTQGLPNPLAQLPIQYADFACWQRQWLTGSVLNRQLNYWQKQLAGAPGVLELPTDKPRPPVQTFRGGVECFQLDRDLTQRLKQLSQQSDATLFMTLLAAFLVLISRYSGQSDIVVGSSIANRNSPQIEQLMGFFANTLALRGDLSGNPSFADFLAQVRQTTLSAYAHQDLPFEMLVEKLQPERDLSRNPLVQVMFSLQNAPQSSWNLPGLTTQKMSLPLDETVRFDLEVSYWEVSGGLEGVWSYSADLFDASTIERMAAHFQTLLEGIVTNPIERISQLPLLTATEQQLLLVEWNNTQADYPQDLCIHQLFEEQVARTPDAVAVVFGNQQLTYYELNYHANQLAHYLMSLGVKADVLVGICVERSLEMVVGLLGIFKAGGAYVPLDPNYPLERIRFMLEDCGASVLLTHSQLKDFLAIARRGGFSPLAELGIGDRRLGAGNKETFAQSPSILCLDNDNFANQSTENPTRRSQPDDLAYVIYTSGSTGQPKGVQLLHRGLSNYLHWGKNYYAVAQGQGTPVQSSLSFDATITSLYLPLICGRTTILVREKQELELLADIVKQNNHLSLVKITPSHLEILNQQIDPDTMPNRVNALVLGGEALHAKQIIPWLTHAPSTRLINEYGPTEAVVGCCVYEATGKRDLAGDLLIGKPIANVRIYILDNQNQLLPPGIPGELCIAGAGLARGYLNRPELTAEKFISLDLFGERERIYKTGDLARWLPDGNLEYLGRMDNQVKIRGFRIELGEIETVLSQYPHVQASCVIAREDIPGNKSLAAYIVSQKEQTLTVSELRCFLKEKLPDYMVPNAIVILEALPFTPNGKVDRRALPAPNLHSQLSDKYVAPRSPIEQLLAHMWAQVLKVKQVGIYNNFFTLGGNSLLATQLVSRIRNILKVELPLRELFARATVAELAHLIGQLQQQNLELSAPAILRRAENAELAPSFAQQRLWFLDQFEPNSAFYNIPIALRLAGTLNRAALEQSLQEIITRHEALRTNFITVDGKPSQIIQTESTWTLSIVELQHLPSSEQEIASKLLAQQQAIQPFDLATQALLRATLVVLNETEHLLLVCMHHIVCDGWSMGIFVQELAALYNAYSQGQISPLSPLPIQYADFAIWQREWLQGDVLQSQLGYWQQQLASAPALLVLPTDRPRPSVQTFAGAYQQFALSFELTDRLTKLSQEQGVTLFMTLLAAFDTLLYRYTGQSDILVGSPIANRDRSEIEGLIGFFVNTLVLRTDVSGNPSFEELLTRVRFMAIDAYAHQNLPFEMLVEALQPERDLSYTPLFQVMFALQNAPISQVELTGLSVSYLPIEGTTAKFDLTLSMENTASGLVGVWEYNTDLFDRSTIERMTGHFFTMLTGIIANPKERISQLPLLTQVGQRQLLIEWNDTLKDYPKDKCIHQLLESQVERTPDAVAVVYENQQLTYYELNCRANQLAHYLRSLGVGADVLVGLCVERSLEMIVGLLGILKAGGAYVPLDPEYPTERLSFMLEDAQVSVLLTQQQLVKKLPHQARVLCLDTDWEKIALECESNLENTATPDNLAYVIYTSGSTGKPKGVLVNHSNVVRLFAATNWYNFNSQDVWTLFHSYAFDFSVWEIWGALLYGGRLVVVPYLLTRAPESFYQLLCQEKVTILNQTPSAFRQLIQAEQSIATVGFVNLRLVIFGGEALEAKSLQPWFERHGDTSPQLVNMYGITETTVHVTYRPLSKADLNNTASVIGRPIPDLQVYVLDEHKQPVPIGVGGEMYVGGAGVARGYLNRPELTAERFISNPFDKSKLYKTGDLARYLPNGELEYLGRIDQQVKVRGFRIELGEIEALLASHPAVWESVVVVREDEPGDKRLVAYVVLNTEQFPKAAELRQFLKAKLPEYMVPSAFVVLESLPLTSNGKVDRRALRAPDLYSDACGGLRLRTDKYVAPRNTIEELLAQIWAQVLKVEQVGVDDNFFTLGGHSLLATQLVSRIRNIFKVELPLRELFGTATLADLAHLIEQLQQQNLQLSAPPILPKAKNAQLPLSFAQKRLWFLDQLQPNSALYNIPIALRLVGTLSVAALQQSLQEIIHRHEALRTNFITVDGQATQIIQNSREQRTVRNSDPLAPTPWTVSIVDLKHLSITEQEIATQQLAQQQAIQPFNLATEPLVRAMLVMLSQTEHAFHVCMHHIVSDGWSMGVFVQELAALYNAYLRGQPSPLTPLPIQYADFAIWQRQWLQGDVLQSQLSYWQQQLKDAPTLLSLPTDRPRPSVQTFSGADQEFALSKELTSGLTQLSQQQGATLFMTLLAAFNTLLYRYTGQSDILVGSPIANRDRSEIEGLIGFFVNILVMRTSLAGNPSFSELLGRVREVALGAYTHQNLPFEMLVEALQPERNLSYTPLFQVMFVLQNAPIPQVELTGLTVSPLKVQSTTTKFDLTLIMQNTATGLVGVWEYNTNLFDASTIERITGHFVTLLEGIIAKPQEGICQLPLLTEVEQHQVLLGWNNTQVNYPLNKCIHQLFEEQVDSTPDAVAVVFADQQLTYHQLNSRANQLAHHLRSLGVGADVLVGICVERSLEMVIGLLGILKAGGAYLPLDPEYPPERLNFMLEDAQVQVLLGNRRLVDKLPEYQAKLVFLDEIWEQIAQNNQHNPASGVRAFHLANVIYTSGSTGKPKGVMVEHIGLCNLAQAQIQTFGLHSDSRILQFASLSFDASIWEVLMAWGSGTTLYLGTKDSLLPGSPLIERLRNYSITHITLPPSALAVMPIEELPALQTIIVAGEASSAELIRQWSAGRNFFNAYGPTEASVCATIAKCNHDEKISIGKAIANTQVYILDENLQPVPVGVPGELHIGGVGLARGYLNRPELTQERFITNPFDKSKVTSQKSKLYKTGDKARYLPDGNIEYLGRLDNQVKIRGFRIELAEIETVLGQHGDVQNCCVIAHEGTPGNKRLVAYVVPQKDVVPTTDDLRQFLSNKLPGYMVPTAFVILESLPLTPNGKVDRRALPDPDLHQELLDYVMPNTEAEKIIAGIWLKALSVEKVGIYDNFFELGGHSLLLVKINQQLQEEFGLELSIIDMFNYPNIQRLSQYIFSKLQKIDTLKQNNLRPQSPNESKAFRNQQLQLRQNYLSQRKGKK